MTQDGGQAEVDAKICGISTPEALEAATQAGARFIGFVFYPPSPRHIDADIAYDLARKIPTGVRAVGLFVDPDDTLLKQITGRVQLDMIQLHGDETPMRVSQIKQQLNMPVIKAIRIAGPSDLDDVEAYEDAADWLLFDAAQGGSGKVFDWSLLKGKRFKKPWMLSGGLTQDNVLDAISLLHPAAVDVSSGVESSRGVKDIHKIKDFINTVKSNE